MFCSMEIDEKHTLFSVFFDRLWNTVHNDVLECLENMKKPAVFADFAMEFDEKHVFFRVFW